MPRNNPIWTWGPPAYGKPQTVALYQHGRDRFGVEYGQQYDSPLRYGPAAAKLGQAIMHALACEGKLDNS